MKNAIFTHLAVSLLGHWDMDFTNVPKGLGITYNTYKNDKEMFPLLLKKASLITHLLDVEIIIPDSYLGQTTLVALALIFNELPMEKDISQVENLTKNDMLFNRMRTRLRLRKL